MRKIMLVCCAGMSTSLLVQRMEDAAKNIGFECKIWACSEKVFNQEYKNGQPEVVLVGPQIRYKLKEFQKIVAGAIPVALIDMRTYGMFDGKTTLELAIKTMDEFYK